MVITSIQLIIYNYLFYNKFIALPDIRGRRYRPGLSHRAATAPIQARHAIPPATSATYEDAIDNGYRTRPGFCQIFHQDSLAATARRSRSNH